MQTYSYKYLAPQSCTLCANYLSKYCYVQAMFGIGKAEKAPLHDDLATYLQRITILEARVTSLELDAGAFRDKVLRKIQHRTEEESAEKLLKPGQKVRR